MPRISPAILLSFLTITVSSLSCTAYAWNPDTLQARIKSFSQNGIITIDSDGETDTIQLYAVRFPKLNETLTVKVQDFIFRWANDARVEVMIFRRNNSGDIVGSISIGTRSLAEELVKSGLGYWDRSGAPEWSNLERLEKEAKASHRGIWATAQAETN